MKLCGYLTLAVFLSLAGAFAQDVAQPKVHRQTALRDGRRIDFALLFPNGFERDVPRPIAFFLTKDDPAKNPWDTFVAGPEARSLHGAGWVVAYASVVQGKDPRPMPKEVTGLVLREIRLNAFPENLRVHLVDRSGFGLSLGLDYYGDFESITLAETPVVPNLAAKRGDRLRFIRFAVDPAVAKTPDFAAVFDDDAKTANPSIAGIGAPDGPKDVLEFLKAARPSENRIPAEIKGPWAALDDFHDAAAKADGPRYFGRFTKNGVFLGTDGTERWTVDEFKKWSEPYFKEAPGWIFIPLDRQMTLEDDGRTAWFNETPWSLAYGPCRGTGLLRKAADGTWKVAQYDLTIPIPNDLSDEVAKMIDVFPFGETRTVYFVRHAEKAGDPTAKDPELSEAGSARAQALARALRNADIKTIFATNYRRTQQTARPLADESKVEITVIDAGDTAKLVKSIRDASGNVLVCGHSNTIAPVLKAFGIADATDMGEFEFDNLYLLELSPGRSSVKLLHYGAPNPLPMPKR